LEAVHANICMFIRWLVLRSRTLHRHTAGSRASAKSIHRLSAVAPPPASLLSTSPAPAGVTPETSRSIKPRERDLRDLRLLFWLGFLRGQRTILDMPSALQTSSRSQYAPVIGEHYYSPFVTSWQCLRLRLDGAPRPSHTRWYAPSEMEFQQSRK